MKKNTLTCSIMLFALRNPNPYKYLGLNASNSETKFKMSMMYDLIKTSWNIEVYFIGSYILPVLISIEHIKNWFTRRKNGGTWAVINIAFSFSWINRKYVLKYLVALSWFMCVRAYVCVCMCVNFFQTIWVMFLYSFDNGLILYRISIKKLV